MATIGQPLPTNRPAGTSAARPSYIDDCRRCGANSSSISSAARVAHGRIMSIDVSAAPEGRAAIVAVVHRRRRARESSSARSSTTRNCLRPRSSTSAASRSVAIAGESRAAVDAAKKLVSDPDRAAAAGADDRGGDHAKAIHRPDAADRLRRRGRRRSLRPSTGLSRRIPHRRPGAFLSRDAGRDRGARRGGDDDRPFVDAEPDRDPDGRRPVSRAAVLRSGVHLPADGRRLRRQGDAGRAARLPRRLDGRQGPAGRPAASSATNRTSAPPASGIRSRPATRSASIPPAGSPR